MRGTEFRFFLSVLCFLATSIFAATVTYDNRALVVDGKRKVLISGSIHYPRSTPEMWPDLIQKSRNGGLDVIETYVFWNLHEPVQNQYDFEGRKDLVKFVKLVAEAGLYVHLRIGPYVCAEWNYGGFPLWLHFIPGIKFRTDNEPFKIENEYGNIDSAYGSAAKSYINWAATMATSLDTGVPWVMCQQADAPDPIEEYDKRLSEVEEYERTIEFRDRIFHELVGNDGHGYCRTYGSGVSMNAVYRRDTVGSSQPVDVIQITRQVRVEMQASFRAEIEDLLARVAFLESQREGVDSSIQAPDAASGPDLRRESVRDL